MGIEKTVNEKSRTVYHFVKTEVMEAPDVTSARPDGTSTFEGTYTYIGGTGRFAGVKGGGSYTGKRLAPVSQGAPADAFSENISAYTLPQ